MPIYQCKCDGSEDRTYVDVAASSPHKAAEKFLLDALFFDRATIHEIVKVVVRSQNGEMATFNVETGVVCTASLFKG